ncbi:RNA-binding transcriptional accessory protein, partial [Escherichia coli]
VQVRVMQVDVERNRVNLSMRAEGAAPVKAQRPPRREQNNEQRSERKPQGKRPQPRKDQVERPQRSKQEKPQEQKIGGFGALLLQAGIKGSK